MKPVGLKDPRSEKEPYAVVQLRQEDRYGQAYNMVGFQTRMKWTEQRKGTQDDPPASKMPSFCAMAVCTGIPI